MTFFSRQALLLKGSRHFFNFKEFKNIAHFNIVIALDIESALEAFFDFFGIIFKALE
jgi:hypothetical protein